MNAEIIKFRLDPWACPICETNQTRTIGLRGGPHQRNKMGIITSIKQCTECSLLFPDPFPIPENLQSLYSEPESYFSQHNSEEKVKMNRIMIQKIKLLLGNNITILDVGSGSGELLEAAKKESIAAVGIEMSPEMISYAKKNYSVDVEEISIESATTKWPKKFDAIVLNAVLEHVHNPQSMIAAASKLLRPQGIIYIDVPNEPNLITFFGNTWNKIFGNPGVYNLSPTWPPYHVYGFNPKCLKILLEKNGFKILSFEVFAPASFKAGATLGDKIKTFLANQIAHVANWTGTSTNLVLWAKYEGEKPE